MNKISLIILVLLMFSCKDEEKYSFIYKVFKNPDNLENYINEAKFNSDPFKMYYFRDTLAKQKSILKIQKDINTYFTKDLKVIKDSYYKRNLTIDSSITEHIIIIEGSEKRQFHFIWDLLNNQWALRYIYCSNTTPKIYPNGIIPLR